MLDYKPYRYYIAILLITFIGTTLLSIQMPRGFLASQIGLSIGAILLYWKANGDERNILQEALYSLIGFLIIPAGYYLGVYAQLIPTPADIVWFIVGFCVMSLIITFLYVYTPKTRVILTIFIIILGIGQLAIIYAILIFAGGWFT